MTENDCVHCCFRYPQLTPHLHAPSVKQFNQCDARPSGHHAKNTVSQADRHSEPGRWHLSEGLYTYLVPINLYISTCHMG